MTVAFIVIISLRYTTNFHRFTDNVLRFVCERQSINIAQGNNGCLSLKLLETR